MLPLMAGVELKTDSRECTTIVPIEWRDGVSRRGEDDPDRGSADPVGGRSPLAEVAR